jgi:DNA-binding transcriptional ArsR family regulator
MEARDRVSQAAVQVKALLDPQLREVVENLAKSEGVTPSEYLERLIRKALETGETEAPPPGS